MVTPNAYSRERLVHLVRLLRPAPQPWVSTAQAAILALMARDRAAVDETPLTETQLADLRQRLDGDPAFRGSFDADPIAAADAAGWPELARGIERELSALVALAERIAADDVLRAELETDLVGTIASVGLPSTTAQPFMRAVGRLDAELAVPDVVAHEYERPAPRGRLIVLLLGTKAFAAQVRNGPSGA
jgi:hypothetical protein